MKLVGIAMFCVGAALLVMLWPRGGKEAAVFSTPGMVVIIPLVVEMLLVAGGMFAVNG